MLENLFQNNSCVVSEAVKKFVSADWTRTVAPQCRDVFVDELLKNQSNKISGASKCSFQQCTIIEDRPTAYMEAAASFPIISEVSALEGCFEDFLTPICFGDEESSSADERFWMNQRNESNKVCFQR